MFQNQQERDDEEKGTQLIFSKRTHFLQKFTQNFRSLRTVRWKRVDKLLNTFSTDRLFKPWRVSDWERARAKIRLWRWEIWCLIFSPFQHIFEVSHINFSIQQICFVPTQFYTKFEYYICEMFTWNKWMNIKPFCSVWKEKKQSLASNSICNLLFFSFYNFIAGTVLFRFIFGAVLLLLPSSFFSNESI